MEFLIDIGEEQTEDTISPEVERTGDTIEGADKDIDKTGTSDLSSNVAMPEGVSALSNLAELSNLPAILIAGGSTPLEPLSRNADSLKNINPVIAIQRLIWTPVYRWYDLKRLSEHNAGLRVALCKQNAALLCNFVIKTRYPDEAEWLGLKAFDPLSKAWLIPNQQLESIQHCEDHLFRALGTMAKIEGQEHLYELGVSFLEPGPALLFGLESKMVFTDRSEGSLVGGLRQEVAKKCLIALTQPGYVKPKGYGRWVAPRSTHGAIAWYYDQCKGEDAIKEFNALYVRAEPPPQIWD